MKRKTSDKETIMDLDAKIRVIESDIRMKMHYLKVQVSPPASDIIFKSSLKEQIRQMENEVEVLKQLRDASKD